MEVLAKPFGHEDRTGPEMWIDEAIWGHRLHDEQSPWLTLLEFLCVLHAENGQTRALTEARVNELSYRPQTQLRLRNLLFNNPHMTTVLSSGQSDEAMWSAWQALMTENAGGLERPDFAYLRDHFETFQDFSSVVSFLQSSAIEGGSNKRWSSKFVFPFGTSALYEDVSVTATGVATDRRFFARTGEILYLMLCRSQRAAELRERLARRILDVDAPYDGLIRALQGDVQLARQERAGAYLPCASHPTFDRLAEDWIAILDLQIPAYDAIPHLVTMTGLHLILYQLQRASEVLALVKPITLVCEIVSPKRSVVRDLSADSFQGNNALPQQALERFVRDVADTSEWRVALQSDEPGPNAAEVLSTAATQHAALEVCDFRRAFAQLSDSHREVLALIGASGLSYEEAAKVCDCAVGTVKSRVSRAREELTRLLSHNMLLRRTEFAPIAEAKLFQFRPAAGTRPRIRSHPA